MLRRLGLGTLLVAGTVLIVLATVACLLAAGSGLMRRLADEQALARVRLAGEAARQAVEQAGASAETSARLLAERPTLARLVSMGPGAGETDLELATFLGRFARTSDLGACLLVRDGRPLATGGALKLSGTFISALPRPPEGGASRFVRSHPGEVGAGEGIAPEILLAGEVIPLPANPSILVVAVRPLDAPFGARLSEQIGLRVRIRPAGAVGGPAPDDATPGDPRAESLRAAVLDGGERGELRCVEPAEYLAVLPIHDPAGGLAGLIEVHMPSSTVDASLLQLDRRLLLLSLGVASIAAILGILLARRLVRPLGELTVSAARIGEGDLTTPIPRTSGGEVGTLSATMDDMRTRLLDLTAELRRRQGEAEAVLTGIVEGVFSVDRERRIRYLNPPMAALLGVRAEEAAGRFCGDLLKPIDSDGTRPCDTRCPILDARFRGRAIATESIGGPGGARRSVVITSSAPESGASPQFQVARDETEMEAGRRLRDIVVANISHEFRTPLSAQLASIELLRDRLPDLTGAESAALVNAIERGTLRLTRLIDNLLESARIEAGRDTIRRTRVQLDEVIEEAADQASPLIEQRNQRLQVDLPWPLPEIEGDAPRLVQVFVNLLANANKFAPEGSAIRVGGRVGGSGVTLWIEDEGPGLPAEGGEALFGRFVRSPGEEPEESGIGLGLWIVRSIVTRHGGRVEAIPAGGTGGRGTRMSVTLPLAAREEPVS